MSLSLPDPAAKHFIKQVLVPAWDPSAVYGYDPSAPPSDDAHLPTATSLDTVGEQYPSLVVQFSNESAASGTTYDYITPNGPGQNREGQLLAVARAEDKRRSAVDGYTVDESAYGREPAEDIVAHIIEHVEAICQQNATGGSSAFETIGSQRGSEAPDDLDPTPIVRIANAEISYSYLRQQ